MKNSFPNEATLRVWKLIEFQGRNNLKTPLKLLSFLINTDPANNFELDKEETKTNNFEM